MISPATNYSVALQRKMQDVRRNLNEHSDEMVKRAREQLNWKTFVGNHPLLCLGTAATLGFLLVPRKRRPGADPHAMKAIHEIKESVEQAMHTLRTSPRTSPSTHSDVVSSLTSFVSATLLREGMRLAMHFGRQWLDRFREGAESHGMEERKEFPIPGGGRR